MIQYATYPLILSVRSCPDGHAANLSRPIKPKPPPAPAGAAAAMELSAAFEERVRQMEDARNHRLALLHVSPAAPLLIRPSKP